MSTLPAATPSASAGLILGMLAAHPQSGYELKKHADQTLRAFWALSYAQIYPELARLRREDFIAAEPIAARRRRRYQITPRGRAALLRWLRDRPLASMQLRDELLLRLYIAALVSPRNLRGLLRDAARREAVVVDALRRNRSHLVRVRERGENWDEALAILRSLEAMHRAYRGALLKLVSDGGRR
jgi:DNA-binding PadR family transcriptional regulator